MIGRFDFECSCGRAFEAFCDRDTPQVCQCGKAAKRLFSPPKAFGFSRQSDPRFDDMRAKHSAWYNSEKCQQGLRDGTLRHLEPHERVEDLH